MVIIIETPTLARLLARVGIEPFLRELADRIEADFARWRQFEKSARLGSHSKVGMLELMPSADADWFSFKSRIEGDIQSLGPEGQARDLWEVIAARLSGRTGREQITIFDSVGFAIEDCSTLRCVYDKTRALGVGSDIALIPKPPNPKDLFGYVAGIAAL